MEDPGLLAAPRLTAQALRAWEIPRVIRGYDMNVVEEMRRAAAAEITELITERDELGKELEWQQREASKHPAPGLHAAPEMPDPGEQAARILMTAQRQREQVVTQAQAYARQLGEDGENRRRAILADAQRRCQDIMEEAQARADSLSRSLLEDAHQKAADILARAPMDAQKKLTTTKALADVWAANLRAFCAGLSESLDTLDKAMTSPPEAAMANGNGGGSLTRAADQGQG